MDNENEFEFMGVAYKAVDSASNCDGCSFSERAIPCISAPDCRRSYRDDGRNVIFVEKHP